MTPSLIFSVHECPFNFGKALTKIVLNSSAMTHKHIFNHFSLIALYKCLICGDIFTRSVPYRSTFIDGIRLIVKQKTTTVPSLLYWKPSFLVAFQKAHKRTSM